MLAVALELSGKSWKVGLHDGQRERASLHTLKQEAAAARVGAVIGLIEQTRAKWALAKEVRVEVIYEAGQDGFWIARALEAHGYAVRVVDPASIPVERHARRAKTDRLDVLRLLSSLMGWLRGERDRMRVIRVPEAAAEGQRHWARERGLLQKEIGQHRDRIRKLLRTVGCWVDLKRDVAAQLTRGEFKDYEGCALGEALQERLRRESERLALVEAQLKRVEQALAERLSPEAQQRTESLSKLKGIAQIGAWRLVLELFWRNFNNQRQVGACVGLVPQPYDSGDSRVDQGISKQGNRRVRALLIQMAWMWLRYQPDSALAQWFRRRWAQGGGSKRGKRIAIVALARRLAIALWRYLKDGVVPEGAALKRA
jgi:transposase